MSSNKSNFVAELKRDEIVIGRKLGEGAYGSVFEGTCRGSQVAVKIPKKQKLTASELAEFKREINKMAEIRHSNICEYYGVIATENSCIIVTEKLVGDVESRAFDNTKPLPFIEKLKWAREAAKGMAWLHGNDVIHFDFKLSNLLYDRNGIVKVCDLGLSMHSQERKTTKPSRRGTPVFMSPEVILSQAHPTLKVDLYSYALSMWELFTGGPCFTEFTDANVFYRSVCNGIRPDLNTILKFYPNTPQKFLRLLSDCWANEPNRRPTFEQVVQRLNEIIIESSILDPIPEPVPSATTTSATTTTTTTAIPSTTSTAGSTAGSTTDSNTTNSADFTPDPIAEPSPRAFWKKYFGFEIEVKWTSFAKALSDEFNFKIHETTEPLAQNSPVHILQNAQNSQRLEFASRSIENFKMIYPLYANNLNEIKDTLTLVRLQKLFATQTQQNETVVKIETFGRISGFFRPFATPHFKELCDCVNQPWFHPEVVDSTTIQSRLGGRDNHFLIRFSGGTPSTFVLAYHLSRLVQIQITRTSNGLLFYPSKDFYGRSNQLYKSIAELISAKVFCVIPAPGSQLAEITNIQAGQSGYSAYDSVASF
eukprot:TRINITY_DN689_c0_g3_i1.p1 TRINITY_DN689_c0_g3~~TRINITY_DN689_c0_g3_i1.p1  ORF type:complete len:593 (-),score=321.46 TRINITY_DN689_c0_g3_i1:116-1894(-)